MTQEAYTSTSVAFLNISPNALKHTRKTGDHVPITSTLLASEMASLFHEKLDIRIGDQLPAEFATSHLRKSLRIYLNSQTSANTFREIIADLYPEGTCTAFHYLEHKKPEKFEQMNKKMQDMPFYYVVNVEDSVDT